MNYKSIMKLLVFMAMPEIVRARLGDSQHSGFSPFDNDNVVPVFPDFPENSESTVQRQLQTGCPINLVVVLDASGTMEGSKWETAKQALLAMNSELNINLIYVVEYANFAKVVAGPIAYSSAVDAMIAGAQSIGGGTFLNTGLNLANSNLSPFLASPIPTKFVVIGDFLLDDLASSNSVMNTIKQTTNWEPWCVYVGPNNDPSKPDPVSVANGLCGSNVQIFPDVNAFLENARATARLIAACETSAPTSSPVAMPTAELTQQPTPQPTEPPTKKDDTCGAKCVPWWFAWMIGLRRKKVKVTSGQLADLLRDGKISYEDLAKSLGKENADKIKNLVAEKEQQKIFHKDKTLEVMKGYAAEIRLYIDTANTQNVLSDPSKYLLALDKIDTRITDLDNENDPAQVTIKASKVKVDLDKLRNDVEIAINREIAEAKTGLQPNGSAPHNMEIGRTTQGRSYTNNRFYLGLFSAGNVQYDRGNDISNAPAPLKVTSLKAPTPPAGDRVLPEWPPKQDEEITFQTAAWSPWLGIPSVIGARKNWNNNDMDRLKVRGWRTEFGADQLIHNSAMRAIIKFMGWQKTNRPTEELIAAIREIAVVAADQSDASLTPPYQGNRTVASIPLAFSGNGPKNNSPDVLKQLNAALVARNAGNTPLSANPGP